MSDDELIRYVLPTVKLIKITTHAKIIMNKNTGAVLSTIQIDYFITYKNVFSIFSNRDSLRILLPYHFYINW